jgi:DNA-binding HxlR family transcriptional regulator
MTEYDGLAEHDEPAEREEPAEHDGPAEREGPAEHDGPAEHEGPAEHDGPTEREGPAEHDGPAEHEGPAERPDGGEAAPGGGAERRRLEEDFLLAMRRAGSVIQLLGQVSADRIGINATDLNCLNIVALTGHMSAGDLARQTGLSTASITGVLDRLEEGGFVRRVRDPHDRRRVIVELGGGPGLYQVGSTFGPVVKAWRAAAASYSDDELRLLLEFQGRLEEIMRGQLARLRGEEET